MNLRPSATPSPATLASSLQPALRRLGPTCAVLLLALLLAGCGDNTRTAGTSDGGDALDPPPPSDGYGAPDQDTTPDQDTPPDAVDGSGGDPGDTEPEAEEEPRQRPDDVSQWQPEDFASAKKERDPKLPDAVKHLDQDKFRSSAGAARVLAGLLTVEEAPQAQTTQQPSSDGYGGGYAGAGGGGYAGAGGGYAGADGGYGGSRGGYDSSGGAGNTTIQIEEPLAEEVIAVLGRNTSDLAVKAISMLVAGEVKTPLDAQSTFSVALGAIAENMRPEYEELAYQLATSPEDIIKAPEESSSRQESDGYAGSGYGGSYGSDTLSADWVRDETLREIEQWGNMTVRSKLANYLDDPKLIAERAEPVERLLASEDPRNLPAQIVMFRSRHTSDDIREQLDERLARGSQEALAHLMGVEVESSGYSGGYGGGYGRGYGGGDYGSGDYGRGGRSVRHPRKLDVDHFLSLGSAFSPSTSIYFGQRPRGDGGRGGGGYGYGDSYAGSRSQGQPDVDPEESYAQLARLLWTDEMAEEIGSLLLDADSLDERPELLRVLASMPVQAARVQLGELLDKFDNDGPSGFSSAGIFGQEVADPALLLTAKSMYHGDKKRRPSARTRPRTRGGDGYAGSGGAVGAAGDTVEEAWESEVDEFVRMLAERFADAESPWPVEEADDQPDDESSPAEDPFGPLAAMPVRLHANAVVVAEYHLRLPEFAQTIYAGANVAPVEVHYVRIEEENRPTKLATHYKRQAGRNPVLHQSDSRGRIDALHEDSTTGERQSIDISIYNDTSGFGGGGDLRPNDPRDIVVEILTVTIPGKVEQEPAGT